jgi:hypothetical protein
MFLTATPPGGIKLLISKLIKAFLTGKIPGDYSYLNPKMSISTSYSYFLTRLERGVSIEV